MPNETLRKTEEKKLQPPSENLAAPKIFDIAKFRALIKLRRAKLESIRPMIPLKTYNIIEEKINGEEQQLEKIVTGHEKEAAKKQRIPAGILPKSFFELRTLKPKTLRID